MTEKEAKRPLLSYVEIHVVLHSLNKKEMAVLKKTIELLADDPKYLQHQPYFRAMIRAESLARRGFTLTDIVEMEERRQKRERGDDP